MEQKRKGFTLIEIALFLAITGLLFVGIIVGTNNSIFQQRFTDSVQNFAEFLRSIYSEVSNPQSVGEGRSDTAIYGKLVVFGQNVGLDGEPFDDEREQRIYVYDVVGDVKGIGSGDVKNLLSELDANVVVLKNERTNAVFVAKDSDEFYYKISGMEDLTVEPAGIVQTYIPRWGASIEKSKSEKGESGYKKEPLDNLENIYRGSILIVRHPNSGTINTLIGPEIDINTVIKRANEVDGNSEKINIILNLLKNEINKFETKTVDLCVNPYGVDKYSDWRRDIRLINNARNASGVEIIDIDSKDNVCRYDPESE